MSLKSHHKKHTELNEDKRSLYQKEPVVPNYVKKQREQALKALRSKQAKLL